jgi:formylglycine-generating enzyme required for sulfatase activity/class 3 adenylate cyclase
MRRTLTVILASDVAGYSRLVADREEDTIRRFHQASTVFSELVKKYQGSVFNTAGDAILARFDSAVDAIRCAIEIQDTNNAANAQIVERDRLLFRIGIAFGDVLVADNGDLLGDAVNVAARLEQLADPGGICISDNVQAQLLHKIRLNVLDLGDQDLRNIPWPVRAYKVFPPSKLDAAPRRRWFLSYNSQDLALLQALEPALRKDGDAHVFSASKRLRACGYWLPEVAREIAEATAFVLLVGENGIGPSQVSEYFEAIDRRMKAPAFPVVLVLLEGQCAPGLPFLRQLPWIIVSDPMSEESVAKLIDASAGAGTRPRELWRHSAPYRGLAAMTEADSDFFFGRAHEIVETIRTLEANPDKLAVLLGNSGVGKSSLAQAGVMAALARQAWPEHAAEAGPWPQAFHDSRQWCFLTVRPGVEPIKTLVEAFLETWQFDALDPARIKQRNEWVELLLDGNDRTQLADLLDETERRYAQLDQLKPPAYFLYIDQGEELYVRAEPRQRARFSEILAHGLSDPRLRALMSLRADFSGALQNDQPLFEAYRRIEVPPLREVQLRNVVSRPAEYLSARFEIDHLANDIARRTAEESTKDAGALPLLSYLLDDMWSQMVGRGDGVLRLPPAAMEVGGVLAERANAFLLEHPQSEEALRRLLTLKLATVREDGEPTRRRAGRSEFSDEEWRLVSDLADHPNRLLVTVTPEGGETYAEVAHEAIFRRWDTLRDWIAAERDFLAWRSRLEAARHAWEATPDGSKSDALLMGAALTQAQSWLAVRRQDLPVVDRDFIDRSVERESKARRRVQRVRVLIYVLLVGIIAGLVGWINQAYVNEQVQWYTAMRPYMLTDVQPYVLTTEAERALKPLASFRECAKDCPEMVVLPAGRFVMGSPATEKGRRRDDEGPQHAVTFARPFAVAKFDVTFADWDACVSVGGCPRVSDTGFGRGTKPLINVTWEDAQLYVAWFSKMTGRRYRLLTEAEWEYAARAGTTTAYYWGDEIGTGNANCNGCGSKWDNRETSPVGSFKPNAFGLYDMAGNVWQWVQDCYHDNYEGAPANGSEWTSKDCRRRIVRGGAWGAGPQALRAASRLKFTPDNRLDYFGFRVARTLGPDPGDRGPGGFFWGWLP